MITTLDSTKAQFAYHVQRGLAALYDPAILIRSPLIKIFDLDQQGDSVVILRRILIDAIEALRPDELAPLGSRGWRVYQVLHRRYTEQVVQSEVAVNLGLSIRQLQREEKIAREVLTERLWVMHDLASRTHLLTASNEGNTIHLGAPTTDEELRTLSESTPDQVVELDEIVQEVLDTLQPLLARPKVVVEYHKTVGLSHVSVKVPILRQALVNLISVAIQHASGGKLLIRLYSNNARIGIRIQASQNLDCVLADSSGLVETLEMTNQLLAFCHSELRIESQGDTSAPNSSSTEVPMFAYSADFQMVDTFVVLVIDDNADTRHLLQRYLYGTSYQFAGIEDAQLALAVAEKIKPCAIVLDVMMPKQDGWAILEKLRKHANTQTIPIIVSTILPQKDLAFALGANEFIRKPVKRSELLAALARHHVARSESG